MTRQTPRRERRGERSLRENIARALRNAANKTNAPEKEATVRETAKDTGAAVLPSSLLFYSGAAAADDAPRTSFTLAASIEAVYGF
jgi:hypothetical protein